MATLATPEYIAELFQWGMIAWLAVLAIYMGFRLLTCEVSMLGLVQASDGVGANPERLTALVIILFIAGKIARGMNGAAASV